MSAAESNWFSIADQALSDTTHALVVFESFLAKLSQAADVPQSVHDAAAVALTCLDTGLEEGDLA